MRRTGVRLACPVAHSEPQHPTEVFNAHHWMAWCVHAASNDCRLHIPILRTGHSRIRFEALHSIPWRNPIFGIRHDVAQQATSADHSYSNDHAFGRFSCGLLRRPQTRKRLGRRTMLNQSISNESVKPAKSGIPLTARNRIWLPESLCPSSLTLALLAVLNSESVYRLRP